MSEWREGQTPRILVIVICLGLLIGGVGVAMPESTDTETGTANAGNASLVNTSHVKMSTNGEETTVPKITLENFSAPTCLHPAENFTVSVEIVNMGSNLTVQEVYYRIEGNVITSKLVSIPAETTKTVVFNIRPADTRGFPHGRHMHGVFTQETHTVANLTITSTTGTTEGNTSTEDGTGNESPTTTESTSFTVSEVDFPTTVHRGEMLSVCAIVSNPNDHQVTQEVTLRLNGTVNKRKMITLDPNEQKPVAFSVETSDLRALEYFISIFTQDFGEVAVVSVEESGEETTTVETRPERTTTRNNDQ